MRRALLALSSCSLAIACHGASTSSPRTTSAPVDRVPHLAALTRFEIPFDVPGRTLAPDDVTIEATFTAPSGAVQRTGGFASHGRFVVRFTPREVGRYRYVVRADGGTGAREVSRGGFVTTTAGSPGFVRVDRAHPHRLVHDDGSPLYVLGENRINVYDPTWNEGNVGTAAYVARMAGYGMTTIRVFVLADCESEAAPDHYQIGCLEKGIGRFDEKTADAFDVLFDAAENNGVHVVLVANAIGFTPGDETWRSWNDNPYSKARGGPAASPTEYFTSEALRPNGVRKLRYIADRWGYSTKLLAIDLLNEPEWDGPIPEADWIPWAEAMSRAWRSFDPYAHLVTAGPVGLHANIGSDERPWYASANDDIVQWHLYGKEFYDPLALGPEMARKVRETWDFGKPVICGEFAYGGEDKSTYDHTHVGIWSLLMSGAGALAHSAPPFEIDSDEPMTPARGAHFKALSAFLRAFGAKVALTPRSDAHASVGRAFTLASDDASSRALWLLGPREGYGLPVERATLSIPSPPAGTYRLRWFEDTTATPLAETTITSVGSGPITLPAPRFVRHVAAALVPAEPHP